jgi:hypothetical protein
MTDKQINAAIAEACNIVGKDKYGPIYKTPDGWVVDCPQFSTDLNAMHEAEKTLTDANMFVMAHHIERLVSAHGQHYFHATARQRAEAFLLTLGKWSAADKDSLTPQRATTEESSAVQSTLMQQLRDTAKMGVSDEDCLMLEAADWIEALKMHLQEANARALRAEARAAALEVQMRREGWTQEDLDEVHPSVHH